MKKIYNVILIASVLALGSNFTFAKKAKVDDDLIASKKEKEISKRTSNNNFASPPSRNRNFTTKSLKQLRMTTSISPPSANLSYGFPYKRI